MARPTLPIETVEQIINLLDVKGAVARTMRVNSIFHPIAEKKLYYEVQFTTNLSALNSTLCDTLVRRASAAKAVRVARIRLTLLNDRAKSLIPWIQRVMKHLTRLTTLDLSLVKSTWDVVDSVGSSNLSTIILAGTSDTRNDQRAIGNLLKLSKNLHTLCDFRNGPALSDFPSESLANIKDLYGQYNLPSENPSFSTLTSVTLFDIWQHQDIASIASVVLRHHANLECFRAAARWKTGTISEIFSALNPLTLRELCLKSAVQASGPSELGLLEDLTNHLPRFTNLRVLELPKPRTTKTQPGGNEAMQVDGMTDSIFGDEKAALSFLQTLAPALEVVDLSPLRWKHLTHSNVYVPEGSFTTGLPLA